MARVGLVGLGMLAGVGVACTPEFASLEEACPDRIFGENVVPEAAAEAAQRVACYRRLVGLAKNDINPKLAAANRAHTRYLTENFAAEESLWDEVEGNVGFTGRSFEDRAAYQGYTPPQATHGWFEIVGGQYGDPEADVVDAWMVDPGLRQFFLQPALMDFAYGANNDFVVMSGVYAWPPGEHESSPVLYPASGQAGIPTAWRATADFAEIGDPDFDAIVVPFEWYGFPLSIGFGSSSANSISSNNPLEVYVRAHALTGPQGDVPTVLIQPGQASGLFDTTALIVPKAPLQGGAEYTASADVEWMGRSASVTWTFSTAE